MPPAQAGLISRDPVKNARAILRYALPIDNQPIRRIQVALENISEQVRVPGKRAYGPILGAGRKSMSILKSDKNKIIADLAPNKKVRFLHFCNLQYPMIHTSRLFGIINCFLRSTPATLEDNTQSMNQPIEYSLLHILDGFFPVIKVRIFLIFSLMHQDVGLVNIEKLEAALPSLADVVATEDKNEILYKQQELLEYVGLIEESMLKEFPFQVPAEYKDLPQLKVPLCSIG